MINALEGLAKQWFTPAGQDDSPTKTDFELQPLDGETFTNLHLMLEGGKFTGAAVTYALEVGLIGWRNFKGAQGELDYTRANLRLLPMLARIDLASKIYEISVLGGQQRKNS